jgi:hypothetical protein
MTNAGGTTLPVSLKSHAESPTSVTAQGRRAIASPTFGNFSPEEDVAISSGGDERRSAP